MSTKRSGKRYSLLFLRRMWDRIWAPTFILGILLSIIWWQAGSGKMPLIQSANNLWVLFGAVISFSIGVFAFFARHMNYIQPFPSYVRIVTPFLRMNVSYRRIRSTHPADMMRLFPPNTQSWARRQYLNPFYGNTALSIDMNGLPLSKPLLRFFLPRQLFLPKSTGFVILVAEWMKLSTELDSFIGVWQSNRTQKLK